MIQRLLQFSCLIGLLGLAACGEEAADPAIPVISYISITPNPAIAYNDQLVLRITYEDGNGDLGENTAGVRNLFVKDSRNDITYSYRINQLAPSGATIAIQGEIDINLNQAILLSETTTKEEVVYEVYLTDRAGNESNLITTDTLLVNRF